MNFDNLLKCMTAVVFISYITFLYTAYFSQVNDHAALRTITKPTLPMTEFKQNTYYEDDTLSPCSDFTSTIRVNCKKHGLGHNGDLIQRMGNLATWLCATLEVPPPRDLLVDLHNSNRTIPSNLKWSEYFEMHRISDGSQFVKEIPNHEEGNIPINCTKIVTAIDFKSVKFIPEFEQSLEEAFLLRKANKCFYWQIEGDFNAQLTFVDITHGYPQAPFFCRRCVHQRCYKHNYVSLTSSKSLQHYASSSFPSLYDTLHIRRGDTLRRDCDRSVPAIIRYLSGTISQQNVKLQDTIIIFTDEKNKDYLDELYQSLTKFNQWNEIIFGDQHIASHFANITMKDNYMLYGIASTVIGSAQTQFAARHTACVDGILDNITRKDCYPCASGVHQETSSLEYALHCKTCPNDTMCQQWNV